jgi:hypothetical protein
MDSSMNRGIREGSRPVIIAEEPDGDGDGDGGDFFLGSIDVDGDVDYKHKGPQHHQMPGDTSTSAASLHRVASASCLKRRNSGVTKPKRTISFTNLEIREYDLTIGDNPSVSYGPPVQLSWQYSEGQTRDLEDYESQKELDRSRGRRSHRVENISWAKREALLKRQGFSEDDIQAKMKEVNKMKQGRSVTRALVVTGRAEEALESAGRKLKRFFGSDSQQSKLGRRMTSSHRAIDDSISGGRSINSS